MINEQKLRPILLSRGEGISGEGTLLQKGSTGVDGYPCVVLLVTGYLSLGRAGDRGLRNVNWPTISGGSGGN